jgi:hypothetical protein
LFPGLALRGAHDTAESGDKSPLSIPTGLRTLHQAHAATSGQVFGQVSLPAETTRDSGTVIKASRDAPHHLPSRAVTRRLGNLAAFRFIGSGRTANPRAARGKPRRACFRAGCYRAHMKTATSTYGARFRMMRHALAALIVAAVLPWQSSALTPDESGAGAPVISASVLADPHLVYLEMLDSRGPQVRPHAVALRQLLEQRTTLARQYLQASAAARVGLATALDRIEQQITVSETALTDALAKTNLDDGPYYVMPEPIPFDELRASAVRRRRPIYLPVPQPTPLPELRAPEREVVYLQYLAARAAGSEFARHMVEDTSRLLHEQRELAYRQFSAPADERKTLEIALTAVSQRLHCVAEAIRDAGSIR